MCGQTSADSLLPLPARHHATTHLGERTLPSTTRPRQCCRLGPRSQGCRASPFPLGVDGDGGFRRITRAVPRKPSLAALLTAWSAVHHGLSASSPLSCASHAGIPTRVASRPLPSPNHRIVLRRCFSRSMATSLMLHPTTQCRLLTPPALPGCAGVGPMPTLPHPRCYRTASVPCRSAPRRCSASRH